MSLVSRTFSRLPSSNQRYSYVAQLEHRIEQIEDFIRPLREGRTEIPSVKPYAIHDQADPPRQHEPAEATERRYTSKVPPQAVNPNDSEIGEIDNSENSIDGMAAISFADEEDSGFFGGYSHPGSRSMSLKLSTHRQVLRLILHSCVTFPGLSLK